MAILCWLTILLSSVELKKKNNVAKLKFIIVLVIIIQIHRNIRFCYTINMKNL